MQSKGPHSALGRLPRILPWAVRLWLHTVPLGAGKGRIFNLGLKPSVENAPFSRSRGKDVATSARARGRILIKHPRRCIEVRFQVTWPTFPPQTGPCERSKGLRSAINRMSTSPGVMASPPLQRAQFFVVFISHGSTPRRWIEIEHQVT